MPAGEIRSSAEALAEAACALILAAGAGAVRARGGFRLVLAGGSTPRRCYQLLAASGADLSGWELWYGDERCLPRDDPERNSGMVAASGLTAVAGREHIIPAERGAAAAAAAYARVLPATPFDMVLLGMGPDGHTASLFPGLPQDGADALAVHDAPKPPPERVSLSTARLRATRQVLVLIAGADKRPAIAAWRSGADLPIARVTRDLPVTLLLDTAAAGT